MTLSTINIENATRKCKETAQSWNDISLLLGMAEWIKGTVMFSQQSCWYLLVKHLDEAEKLQTLPYIHWRQLVTSGTTHFKTIKWDYLCYKSVCLEHFLISKTLPFPSKQTFCLLHSWPWEFQSRVSPYVLQSKRTKQLKMTPLQGSEVAFCWKQSVLRQCP